MYQRKRPIIGSQTVSEVTAAIFKRIQQAKHLRYPGHVSDFVFQDWAKSDRPTQLGIDLSDILKDNDAGQCDPLFAAFVVLFSGFIGLGMFAFYAAAAFGPSLVDLLDLFGK